MTLPLVVGVLLVVLAAFRDLRSGHIPNALTLGGLGLGAALQLASPLLAGGSLDGASVMASMARLALGIVLCGLVPYVLFARGAMGGGDVKLLAALGALLGPVTGLEVQLYAFVAMSLFAAGCMVFRGRLLATLRQAARILINPVLPPGRRTSVPIESLDSLRFGPAVLVAITYVAVARWSAA